MEDNLNLEFKAKVLHQINFARVNPKKFAKIIRSYIPYFKGKLLKYPDITPIMTTEGSKAFEDAAIFLDKIDPLPNLTLDANMNSIAYDTLNDILQLQDFDQMDSLNVDDYIDKYGVVVGRFAQALDFGSPIPEMVAINLIVDDGDVDRANRHNMFNNNVKMHNRN